jgi:hypothetical protein
MTIIAESRQMLALVQMPGAKVLQLRTQWKPLSRTRSRPPGALNSAGKTNSPAETSSPTENVLWQSRAQPRRGVPDAARSRASPCSARSFPFPSRPDRGAAHRDDRLGRPLQRNRRPICGRGARDARVGSMAHPDQRRHSALAKTAAPLLGDCRFSEGVRPNDRGGPPPDRSGHSRRRCLHLPHR